MKKTAIFIFILSLFLLHGIICAQEDEDKPVSAGSLLNLSGYVQTMYSSGEDSIDGFRIRRARLKLKGEILKNLHYNLQIDAVKSPCLIDATVEFPFSPLANLVFGQFNLSVWKTSHQALPLTPSTAPRPWTNSVRAEISEHPGET